jgi:hypothetical protein
MLLCWPCLLLYYLRVRAPDQEHLPYSVCVTGLDYHCVHCYDSIQLVLRHRLCVIYIFKSNVSTTLHKILVDKHKCLATLEMFSGRTNTGAGCQGTDRGEREE